MSRILVADDSPHAQRMCERILRDEGYEVITVSDGAVAMLRLGDTAPDLIIADISMPEVSGYELCSHVKSTGSGIPVILTAGAIESVDEAEVTRVRADGVLKKPFEAGALLASVSRFKAGDRPRSVVAGGPLRSVVVVDPNRVRAAVTLALDQAMPAMIDEITARVLTALALNITASGKPKP